VIKPVIDKANTHVTRAMNKVPALVGMHLVGAFVADTLDDIAEVTRKLVIVRDNTLDQRQQRAVVDTSPEVLVQVL
jgi:hypothetical protein